MERPRKRHRRESNKNEAVERSQPKVIDDCNADTDLTDFTSLDTWVSLQLLTQKMRRNSPLPPIILKSHLSEMLSDPTCIDSELQQLRASHTLRVFKIPCENESTLAVLPQNEYYQLV